MTDELKRLVEDAAKLADSMNTFGEPPDIGAAIRGRG